MAFDLDDDELRATRILNGCYSEIREEREEKMEIGDYYRTKKGGIYKVKTMNTPETRRNKHLGYVKRNVHLVNGRHTLEDIVSHSKNIIDLVEIGDYVNGHKVKQINCKLEYIDDDSDTGVNEVDNGLEIEGYPTWIYFECEIESIVTKEQYKSVEYVF